MTRHEVGVPCSTCRWAGGEGGQANLGRDSLSFILLFLWQVLSWRQNVVRTRCVDNLERIVKTEFRKMRIENGRYYLIEGEEMG